MALEVTTMTDTEVAITTATMVPMGTLQAVGMMTAEETIGMEIVMEGTMVRATPEGQDTTEVQDTTEGQDTMEETGGGTRRVPWEPVLTGTAGMDVMVTMDAETTGTAIALTPGMEAAETAGMIATSMMMLATEVATVDGTTAMASDMGTTTEMAGMITTEASLGMISPGMMLVARKAETATAVTIGKELVVCCRNISVSMGWKRNIGNVHFRPVRRFDSFSHCRKDTYWGHTVCKP